MTFPLFRMVCITALALLTTLTVTEAATLEAPIRITVMKPYPSEVAVNLLRGDEYEQSRTLVSHTRQISPLVGAGAESNSEAPRKRRNEQVSETLVSVLAEQKNQDLQTLVKTLSDNANVSGNVFDLGVMPHEDSEKIAEGGKVTKSKVTKLGYRVVLRLSEVVKLVSDYRGDGDMVASLYYRLELIDYKSDTSLGVYKKSFRYPMDYKDLNEPESLQQLLEYRAASITKVGELAYVNLRDNNGLYRLGDALFKNNPFPDRRLLSRWTARNVKITQPNLKEWLIKTDKNGEVAAHPEVSKSALRIESRVDPYFLDTTAVDLERKVLSDQEIYQYVIQRYEMLEDAVLYWSPREAGDHLNNPDYVLIEFVNNVGSERHLVYAREVAGLLVMHKVKTLSAHERVRNHYHEAIMQYIAASHLRVIKG